MWTVVFILSLYYRTSLNQIKSNHWFIVPFAVGSCSGYNGLPGRTLPVNLIHETVRRSERVDNAALSSAVSYEIPGQMMERTLFCTFSRWQARDLGKPAKKAEAYSSIERISAQ